MNCYLLTAKKRGSILNWVYEMKEKDEEKRMEVEHQKLVSRMIRIAEGRTGLLHKITNPTPWRGGVQILNEGGRRRLVRCEEKKKEWAKHWQCDTTIQDKGKPW